MATFGLLRPILERLAGSLPTASTRGMDKDLYDLSPEELKEIPAVCGFLREDVFTRDQIEAYCEVKSQKVYSFEHTPRPAEFEMCHSV